jgi:putative ABC transport system permease protein
MAQLGEFLRRFSFFLQRDRLDRDLEEEMRDHLRRKTEKNIAAGLSPSEAFSEAQRQLGNFTRQQEESRLIRGFPLLDSIFQDLRYGLRGLRNSPGFTAVAVLTLALGIGSATAIFSIVNAVVLRPLPYKDSNRLVHVWGETPSFPDFKMGISYPDIQDLSSQTHSFEAVAFYKQERPVLTGSGAPEQITAMAVSPDYFRVFSIQPILGSGFQPGDEEMKNGHVVLLNYALWQQRFAGDPKILGQTVEIDHVPYTVAGVLPQGFAVFRESVWIPLVVPAKEKQQRENWMFMTLAKLKPGVPIRGAQAELNELQARLAQAYPKEEAGQHLEVMPLLDGAVNEDIRTQLFTLVGAVSFLLLIGCANVSNLILSRGVQRQREIALRAALGASRARILRQLLAESLLLTLVGGVAGLLLADAGIHAFRAFAPAGFARIDEIHMEPAVALIALLVSGLAGVLCGLAPALTTSRADLTFALKDRAGIPARHPASLRNFLVVSEISLALALLSGSALMMQSFVRLMKVDPGFRTDHLLSAQITLGNGLYPSEEARQLFTHRLLDSLQGEPQFTGVALANSPLMRHSVMKMMFDPEQMGIHEKVTSVEAKWVSPRFLEVMGIGLLAGRSFTEHDVKGSPQVVIFSQSMAKRYLPGQDPVGKLFKTGPAADDAYTIVGLASDIRDVELDQKLQPQVYFPILQTETSSITVMVRSSADPLTLVHLLQQRVWAVDKDLPLTEVASMGDVIAESVAEPRFRMWLLSAFAVSGLTLTLIGIYGVISYSVNQRAQEMGIRVALGAEPRDVLGLVLKQGIGLALVGAAVGVLGSFGLTRVLRSQLYGIKPGDPLTLASAALLIMAVALFASYLPARRAARVDPMIVLRKE